MTRLVTAFAFALTIFGGAASMSAATDEAATAQSLLFDANYLLPLSAPSRLTYTYSTKTADQQMFGQDFDDEVALKLSPSAQATGGEKDVTVDMFTGERQRVLGPLTQVSGNPVIMMFLERDVSQMNRHVGGQAVYFRNVIRLALREAAKLDAMTIDWDGKQVQATKITIRPFINDPHGERMQLFKTKTYEFVVSDAVPGGIYQVHATIGEDGPRIPAVDSKLTLKGIAYDSPKQ